MATLNHTFPYKTDVT